MHVVGRDCRCGIHLPAHVGKLVRGGRSDLAANGHGGRGRIGRNNELLLRLLTCRVTGLNRLLNCCVTGLNHFCSGQHGLGPAQLGRFARLEDAADHVATRLAHEGEHREHHTQHDPEHDGLPHAHREGVHSGPKQDRPRHDGCAEEGARVNGPASEAALVDHGVVLRAHGRAESGGVEELGREHECEAHAQEGHCGGESLNEGQEVELVKGTAEHNAHRQGKAAKGEGDGLVVLLHQERVQGLKGRVLVPGTPELVHDPKEQRVARLDQCQHHQKNGQECKVR
mmetsp:Transcript_23990/g.74711  ORF Transcript_23990/g.74711 Transcript_23990/m.74711 type:complete len:284 (-) Transcript_23990:155-1006(-)